MSNPFIDSTSETSDENDVTKRESAPRLGDETQKIPKVKISEAELNKMVGVMILETETFWLLDQKPRLMHSDSDHVPNQIKKNAAYNSLCASRVGSDRYSERAMNTYSTPTIVKNLQTDDILYGEKSVMATVCDMWDAAKKIEEEERKRQEELEYSQTVQASAKHGKNLSKQFSISDLPNAVSRAALENNVHLQLAASGDERLSRKDSEDISDNISTNSDDIASPNNDSMFQFPNEKNSGGNRETNLPTNDPNFLRMLENMDRALNVNSFHDKLLLYRSTQLAQCVAPLIAEASETEISSQFITAHTNLTEEVTMKGQNSGPKSQLNVSVVGDHVKKNRAQSIGPTSISAVPTNSEVKKSEEKFDSAQRNSQTNPKQDNDGGYQVPPDLWLLWKFNCPLTKGRNVSDMAFNVRNKDILAVGYGQFEYDNQRPGLVCCWSLKNISYPERIYKTPSGVTAVAWSSRNDNLLAVGMFSGAIMIYNTRKRGDIPIIDTTHVSGRHYGPIRRLQWVIREAGRSVGDSESLISFCMDGRVSEWFILKGFDCTGECDYHVDLMVLKRPSLRSTGTKNSKKSTEALIVRHGVGTTMSFNPNESNIYLVGTEDGQIHKCSCSYTEQYLSSYGSHTASVYSIKWSPYVPEVFLSCAADWTIKLWHIDRPQPYLTIASHSSAVNDLAWSPKHSVIFACSNESYLEIWNLESSTLDPVHVETVCVDSVVSAVLFTEGSDTIMVGDSIGTVYVYAMKNFPTPLSKPSAQAAQLNGVLASCLSSQLPK